MVPVGRNVGRNENVSLIRFTLKSAGGDVCSIRLISNLIYCLDAWKVLPVDGKQLWVEDDGQDESVFLLHGLTLDRRMWEPFELATSLANQGNEWHGSLRRQI